MPCSLCVYVCVHLTPVADHTNRWRWENKQTFSEQGKLPKDHNLLPKKLNELGHAASGVGYLQEVKKKK